MFTILTLNHKIFIYFYGVKKSITLFILVLFMFTNVIMPYSNYEDAKVLISIYNNSLSEDQDMNFAEFIGEKLIASGINFDEKEESENQNKKTPSTNNLIVQIQSGVIFHVKETPVEFTIYNIPNNNFPISKVSITKNNFQLGILRPPIC